MILDALLSFASGQAVTATADSTNIIDLGTGRDIGDGGGGNAGYLVVQVGTAFAGGTSLNVQFLGAPDNGSGSPGKWTIYTESGAVPVANLTAGALLLRLPFPPARPFGVAPPRFYKLTFTVVGTFTAGTISANVTPTTQAAATYAPGIGITVL